MAAPKFVDVVDSLSGATLSVPEDQIDLFETAGFRRPNARKPATKRATGGKGDESAAAPDRDR